MSVASVIEGIVLAVIQELRGKKPDDLTAKNVASAIAEKAQEAAIAAVQVELRKYEAALGIVLAAHDVNAAVQEVLQTMNSAAPSMTDKLLDGVDIQEMPPDWKSEP